jgi:O-glycosyl hydrolase
LKVLVALLLGIARAGTARRRALSTHPTAPEERMTAQTHAPGRVSARRVGIVATAVALLAAVPAAFAAEPEPAGWYAGDVHAHRSCGGSPASVSTMFQLMAPENLAFASLLADMGNGEVLDSLADLPNVKVTDDSISTSTRTLHWDAEFHWDATYGQFSHQALGGHLLALGVSEAHQIWEEYTAPIFDWAHSRGGIAGFAHMQYLDDTIPQTLNCCLPIEYPVEVALGKGDFISEDVVAGDKTVDGMNPEAAIRAYYRLLNTGFRPGLAAGTDYPCDSGSALGALLTYVRVPGSRTYRTWIDGIAKGHTVVSRNGHHEFLNLLVNGSAGPGDEIALASGGGLPITVTWTADGSYTGTLELVSNGVVVASRAATVGATTPVTLNVTARFPRSGWVVARRMNTLGHQVHTAAVFVTVGGAPVRASVADASFYVQWIDNLLQKTSPGGVWNRYFATSLRAAQDRYRQARAVYERIAAEAAAAQQGPQASTVVVDVTERHQVIQGFGVNYTGPYYRDDQAAMFDLLTKDLGVTMFRVVAFFLGSDWEVANDNDDPRSANWAYYDERYSNAVFEASWKGLRALNARGIKPVLALMGPAPEWMVEASSPPPRHAVCSTSSRIGRLRPDMYDEFAETVVTMAVYARRKAGIQFDYFSPVNETDCYPGEGPRVDPEDMPKLLNAIARRLTQEGLGDVKLVVADNAIIANDYVGPILNDAALMKQVGAFAVHSYSDESVGPHAETIGKGPWSRTPIWLTEYGDLSDLDGTAENEWKSFALASTRRALLALNQGATALFYFNAFDDYEECMRRHTFYGLFTSASHVYVPRKRYYAARQLFHFVAPGAERVGVSTEAKSLTLSAFRDGSAGTVSVVGVTQGGPDRVRLSVPLWKDMAAKWDLYLTTREHECRKVDSFDSRTGVVEFDLPDEAIFTLVGHGGN